MLKKKSETKIKPSLSSEPKPKGEETLDMLTDILIERIIEEKKIIKDKINNDPEARRIYGTCECSKCWIKRFKLRMKELKK